MSDNEKITLAHGGGGADAAELIDREIVSRFAGDALSGLPDASPLNLGGADLLFSTDSHVVQPLFFPGGDIGSLSVYGTVNDVSVAGGKPLFISLALIIEEGFPMRTLRKVLDSVAEAARECGVEIATGDTKVVGKGQCDQIYLNTAGIGLKTPALNLGKQRVAKGDAVLASGTIGDHGMAVLAAREKLPIENGPESDSASVWPLVEAAAEFEDAVKFLRDPTRGGVAAVTNEIVANTDVGILLNEAAIPVSRKTAGVAEILGLDILNVACEGRVLAVCAADAAEDLLAAWKSARGGNGAAIIGVVTDEPETVSLNTVSGGKRLVLPPAGELLPRIC